MDALTKGLLERYRRRRLAHFYLLNAHDEVSLKEWTEKFLLLILGDEGVDTQTCKRRLEQGHPDILWLTPQENSYTVKNGDFDPLFQAMAHRPLELPWRFIIVERPDVIGEVYANKLLKTLEEPSDFCTIIFLQSSSRSLMATIESRAIKLNLPLPTRRQVPEAQEQQTLAQYLGQWSEAYPELYERPLELPESCAAMANELASLSRSKGHIEENLVNGILTWAHQCVSQPKALDDVLKASHHNHFSKIYNNSCGERFLNLVSAALGPQLR